MASLSLKALKRYFGAVKAVDGVSLEVADGEFIALLGPSGCGKTTTLRMVAGLELADEGAIHINRRDVTALPARERDIAMVFQDYALYPHMTVEQNVGYPLKVRGTPAADMRAQVRQVAERLQIAELLERRPGQLSGGQQQRVALARAVVHRANVTLYDEPLSNLDTKLRLEARAFLKHLQREVGVTSLYVTHDQADALALADRIVVMNHGQVMQVGTPSEIYRRPANTFVAAFIGSPPMNLLPCHIDPDGMHFRLDGGHVLPLPVPRSAVAGRRLMLGVRPEDITLHTAPIEEGLPGTLYVTQMLGSETLVVVRMSDQLMAARWIETEDQERTWPEQLWLGLNPNRLYFYDEEGALLT